MSVVSRISTSFRRALHLLARPVRREKGKGGLIIQPYRGYGSRREAFVAGRVYRQGAGASDQDETLWRDLTDLWKRLLRHGKADVPVTARFCGAEQVLKTGKGGYFQVHLRTAEEPPTDRFWHRMHLEIPAENGQQSGPVARVEAQLFVPPPASRFVVISDIDDTVMFTGVANKIRMIWNLFFQGAQSRVAFPGVAAFYRALHEGTSGAEANPMLYVSRGPWSLYEVLDEFFKIHGIPVGPVLFLRDWGISPKRPLPRKAKDHKLELIRRMLAVYDDLPFVLIGDSGQHDPDVYARLARENPERIRAIYIRNVSDPKRTDEIRALAEETAAAGSTLLLAADTVAMAQHACENGLITQDALRDVRGEKAEMGEAGKERPTREIRGETGEQTRREIEHGALEKERAKNEKSETPPNIAIESKEKENAARRDE